MFSRPGYWLTLLLDRKASEAPTFTRPVAASAMPVPEPVDPEVMVMLGSAEL
jgi:hypothetical protein